VLTTEDLSKKLMTRRDFFSLALKLHCVQQETNPPTPRLRGAGEAKETEESKDSLLLSTLTKHSLPFTRTIKGKKYADLSGIITEREGKAVLKALQRKEPKETKETNPSSLPKSYAEVARIKDSRAMTTSHALKLLLQSSFQNGHISLLKETKETEDSNETKELPTTNYLPTEAKAQAGQLPTFSSLPPLPARDCLSSTPSRSQTLSFTDIPPNHPLAEEVYALLPLAALTPALSPKGEGVLASKIPFLIPGTKRPTEFGVKEGESMLNPDQPVSLLETIRALSILSCTPAPSVLQISQNTPPRDLFSNLPNNPSFPSRLFYHAQTIQNPFYRPLFPVSTIPKERPPLAGLSLKEAAPLLTSALLFTEIHEETLSPEEASKKFQELNATVLKFLQKETKDSKETKETKDISPSHISETKETYMTTNYKLQTTNSPFLRSHLLTFLAHILQNKTPHPLVRKSQAERWMERIVR
jgi:hypothetical protein